MEKTDELDFIKTKQNKTKRWLLVCRLLPRAAGPVPADTPSGLWGIFGDPLTAPAHRLGEKSNTCPLGLTPWDPVVVTTQGQMALGAGGKGG